MQGQKVTDEDLGMKDIRCKCGGREGKIVRAETLDVNWNREKAICLKCGIVALERFSPIRPQNKEPATAWVKP